MPQLELFGTLPPEPAVDADQPKGKAADNSVARTDENNKSRSAVELAEETLTGAEIIPHLPEPIELPKPINEVIFSNENISVKIKHKKAQNAPVAPIAIKTLKLPQKRGRKSLKDTDVELDLIEVPEDEELYKKQYYPISVVAQWFKVNTSLLRFWENEFDILKPRKNRKGDRLFRPEDVKNLQLIHHLLRQRKYSIEGAKEYLKGNKEKADIQLQLTLSLQKFRSFLLELKANLQT
ncbi:MerR family transcriptional regulator [Segetibacter sp. 3557_3]|uniref:MerR family transcriptional regulator n=1 Tax=Segetibacter sp. 3557_3 TaxID=2547429 RepID=UPI0010584A00|nr:MerR family transcriptional regulator [Segetibacter sp. 3557_3]TDH24089.1 MerR family transcriptional regulator [Segetibacter sp. 3557_3]